MSENVTPITNTKEKRYAGNVTKSTTVATSLILSVITILSAGLAQAGITLKPVSEEQKVTDVRTKVETGEADAGLVYTTDAKASGDKVETIKIDSHGVVNHYLIAPTKSAANNKDAKIFIDYVNSKDGQAILAKAGFGPAASK